MSVTVTNQQYLRQRSGPSITPDQPGYLLVTCNVTMPCEQYRFVVITDWRAEDYVELPDGVNFIAWSIETAPTTGKLHCQAYAYGQKMSVKAWASRFGKQHVKPMRGSLQQNEAYCSKQAELKKLGTEPMGSGHRRDLEQIKQLCDNIPPGQNVMDLATDVDSFAVCIQYKRGLEAYVANKRRRAIQGNHDAPDVIFITGPSGSGKSRYVRQLEPLVYDIPGGPWRDGYDLQEAVLYDNLEPQSITDRVQFLKEIDRYPIQVPVKGGFTAWKPKRIYITSTYTMDDFAARFNQATEWSRRITSLITLPVFKPKVAYIYDHGVQTEIPIEEDSSQEIVQEEGNDEQDEDGCTDQEDGA